VSELTQSINSSANLCQWYESARRKIHATLFGLNSIIIPINHLLMATHNRTHTWTHGLENRLLKTFIRKNPRG